MRKVKILKEDNTLDTDLIYKAYNTLLNNSEELDKEFAEIVTNEFWDLVTDADQVL